MSPYVIRCHYWCHYLSVILLYWENIQDSFFTPSKKIEVIQVPMKPLKPCLNPGCPNLTDERYCLQHSPLYQRASAHKRGYTSKWQRRSKQFLKKHPLCVKCKQNGKLTPATVVDHIVPHRGNEELMWSESNWQPLCKHCHDKKTGKDDKTPTYSYNFWRPRGVWISTAKPPKDRRPLLREFSQN